MNHDDDDDNKITDVDPGAYLRWLQVQRARLQQRQQRAQPAAPSPAGPRGGPGRRWSRRRLFREIASVLTFVAAAATVIGLAFLGAWLAHAHYNGLHCATICCPK